MKNKDKYLQGKADAAAGSGQTLRQKAEALAREKAALSPEDLAALSPEETGKILHELQVHQIELKMQNDELCRIQGELEKTRDKYSHLYEFAPVGYFTMNEKWIIEEVNFAGAAMIGLEGSALIGKPFTRLVMKEDQDIFYRYTQRLLKTEASLVSELRLAKKDGHELHSRLECTVIEKRGESSMQIRAAVSDITDSKQAEKKIKEYSEKLEQQVDFLQRVEAVGTFAGGIAHDFTNLLTVIISYSTFALEGLEMGSPIREDIEKIIRNAKHGLSLTHWLLLFSRNQMHERKITNLNNVIEGMEKMLRRVVSNEIDLVMLLEPNLGCALVDPAQMELIIINLVSNAVDAMPKGGVLTIATANEEPEESSVQKDSSGPQKPEIVLSVTDTGIGMDRDTLSRIFDPFFTTKEKGTGLGLAIAFDVVQKNDGLMRAYSRPGKGSTFKMYLPGVHEE